MQYGDRSPFYSSANMVTNPFFPDHLIGRQTELQQVSQILAADGDLMVTGIPGSGRRSLIQSAALEVGARVLEIDCLRATTSSRFLERLAEGLLDVFSTPAELAIVKQWSCDRPLTLENVSIYRSRLIWQVPSREEWTILQALLNLPQVMAEQLDCRIVFVFLNFPHIRSWDRSGEWEAYLRQELDRQSRVNYVIVATVPEPWAYESNLHLVNLAPLDREEIESWIIDAMTAKGLKFEIDALDLYIERVRGHLGDAIALARRIWLEQRLESLESKTSNFIQLHHVHRSTLALVEDFSQTFESLLLLLPPIQARVLESLAIDPTDSPHARDYLRKHQLSKGGGLQGALSGLEQKGLIYGGKYGYRVAMPLLALWLKHRLA
ncbi:MAG: ATP-binding protein [Hydrococcus sp. Prado102]|jgi:hypothetical protein|nr:ATP-binding protein [Hydrococcus sp. Prado102]